MLLLSGYHKLPSRQMYWETSDTFVKAMLDAMSRNEFERILKNLHSCDNTKIDKTDTFSKVCPLIESLNETFFEYSFNGETKANR